MTEPRLVMMMGVAPGIGKSTLAASLARTLDDSRVAVDLFPEEELFTRTDFMQVAQGFRDKTYPTPEVFLHAYEATIGGMRTRHAWGVFDWNCAGMASDLPWALAEPERLHHLVRDVRELAADMSPMLFFLDGDIREATRRAAAERGQVWVDHWARIAAEHDTTAESDLEQIARYHEQSQTLRQADLEVLRSAGWMVVALDAMAEPADVLRQAMAAVEIEARPQRERSPTPHR